jgi:hypothetical protein
MKIKLLLIICCSIVLQTWAQTKQQEYYLISIYHCTDKQQIEQIEQYAAQQLIPFLHQQRCKTIGVFVPINNDTIADKKVFIWIPLENIVLLNSIEAAIAAINPFTENQFAHLDSFQNKAPYQRIETMLCSAFKLAPHYVANTSFPKSINTIYEFRSYESATENLHLKKIHMFNEGGEIALFNRLNFNALFYSKCIVGAHTPNLVYLTRFENMEARNEHWKQFSSDAEWKKLSGMKEYANTVSKNETILLKAASCSEL